MVNDYNRDRAVREIVKLNINQVYSPRNLVERILDLSSNDAFEIRTPLIPARFSGRGDSRSKGRKAYKHGLVIPLSQPETQSAALKSREIPTEIRKRDFDSLMEYKQEDLDLVGYSFAPIQGSDRERRIVPFSSIADGMRLYAWMMNNFEDIKVEDYTDARRVSVEGGEFIVHVPSRTRKRFYRTKMSHVPVVDNDDLMPQQRIIAWSLDSNFVGGLEPEFSTYNIFFRRLEDAEGSGRKFIYPQQVAAMLTIAQKEAQGKNYVPLMMNPFATMSQLGADYDTKLRNNLVIYDPEVKGNKGRRKLSLAERSIMLGRLVSVLGYDDVMTTRGKRDPKLRDYRWNISGGN